MGDNYYTEAIDKLTDCFDELEKGKGVNVIGAIRTIRANAIDSFRLSYAHAKKCLE